MTFTDRSRVLRAVPSGLAALVEVAFLAGGLSIGVTLHAQAPGEPPVVLPRVDVSAGVPVVKVADYQLLEARWMPAAVAQGDFIYIIGGLDSHRNRLTSIERFNVRTGKSEPFAQLQIGRRGHRAILVGDKVFVLGGSVRVSVTAPDSGIKPSTDRVMPVTNKQTPEAGRNIDPDSEYVVRKRLGELETLSEMAAQVPERMVVAQSGVIEIVDIATRTVTRAADMPEPRLSFTGVLRAGKIYVIGGQRPYRKTGMTAVTNTSWVLDLATGQWSSGIPMPTPRDNTNGVLVDGGVIVVPGGYDGQRMHDEVEVFNPADGIWRILPPLCKSVSAASVVFFNHYLLLFGSFESPGELIAYDLANRRSDAFTLKYKPARHTAAVVLDGKIYVIGGMASVDGEALNYIQVFAPPKKAS